MNRSTMADLPPYTYVPGATPHPVSDPAGHMFQDSAVPDGWTQEQFLAWGVRLFNAGYYWESHEVWEHLWIDLGRTTPDARTVQGLIKLAACGVKCLEGNANGAQRHAGRSVELLATDCDSPLFAAMSLAHARAAAATALHTPPLLSKVSDGVPISLAGMLL